MMNKKLIISIVGVLIAIGFVFVLSKPKTHSTSNEKEVEVLNKEENKEPEQNEVIETPPTIKEVEKNYEYYLAASAVYGISMNYYQFEIKDIYITTTSSIDNHNDSNGVYITFSDSGNDYILHSKPILKERTEVNTKDIYTDKLGYATFDLVNDIDLSSYTKVSIKDIEPFINDSYLVTIYEH